MTDSVKFTPTKSIDSDKALKDDYTKYNNSAARAEQFSQKYIDQVNIQNAKNNSANRGVSPLEFLEKSADIYGTICSGGTLYPVKDTYDSVFLNKFIINDCW